MRALSERTLSLLGMRVDNLNADEALEAIAGLAGGERPARVNFVNAHCINTGIHNPWYRQVVNSSDLVLPDGIGVRLAGRILGRPIHDNVNGTDLFPRLCALAEERGHSMYLLGGQPGVAQETARTMAERYPRLSIVGASCGYFRRRVDRKEQEVMAEIRRLKPDFLLVGFGVPHQELWAHENLDDLGARVILGVGGLFDYYGGRVRRAPTWIRRFNFEWLWRFLMEPRRLFHRYVFGNPRFLLQVLRARLSS